MKSPRTQPFTAQEFESIYSRVPRVTVEAVIVLDNKVLLSKRTEQSWHGMWHIPGGTILYKETVKDAVKRIAQEELSLEVIVGELLDYIEYPSEEQERGFGWSIGLAFDCRLADTARFLENEQHRLFDRVPENTVQEQTAVIKQALAR